MHSLLIQGINGPGQQTPQANRSGAVCAELHVGGSRTQQSLRQQH